jgi:hypothetical protein
MVQVFFQAAAAIAFCNVSRDTVRSVDAICRYFFEFERKLGKYVTRQNIKRNGVLPDAKLFETSIDVFAIHGVIYPMNRRIFQRDGVNRTHYSAKASLHAQYSSIPTFQL